MDPSVSFNNIHFNKHNGFHLDFLMILLQKYKHNLKLNQ